MLQTAKTAKGNGARARKRRGAGEWFARLTAGPAHPGSGNRQADSPESSLIFQVTLNHRLYSATPINAAPTPPRRPQRQRQDAAFAVASPPARRATDPAAAIWRPALMLPSANGIYGGQRSCSALSYVTGLRERPRQNRGSSARSLSPAPPWTALITRVVSRPARSRSRYESARSGGTLDLKDPPFVQFFQFFRFRTSPAHSRRSRPRGL